MKLENCKIGMEVEVKEDLYGGNLKKGTRGKICGWSGPNNSIGLDVYSNPLPWWVLASSVRRVKEQKYHVDISKLKVSLSDEECEAIMGEGLILKDSDLSCKLYKGDKVRLLEEECYGDGCGFISPAHLGTVDSSKSEDSIILVTFLREDRKLLWRGSRDKLVKVEDPSKPHVMDSVWKKAEEPTKKKKLIITIDGEIGSGKTTLVQKVGEYLEKLNATVTLETSNSNPIPIKSVSSILDQVNYAGWDIIIKEGK